MWRDFELIKLSYFNEELTIELVKTSTTIEIQSKRPHAPSFCWNSWKEDKYIAARISIEHKDDGTSDRVGVLSVENQ